MSRTRRQVREVVTEVVADLMARRARQERGTEVVRPKEPEAPPKPRIVSVLDPEAQEWGADEVLGESNIPSLWVLDGWWNTDGGALHEVIQDWLPQFPWGNGPVTAPQKRRECPDCGGLGMTTVDADGLVLKHGDLVTVRRGTLCARCEGIGRIAARNGEGV